MLGSGYNDRTPIYLVAYGKWSFSSKRWIEMNQDSVGLIEKTLRMLMKQQGKTKDVVEEKDDHLTKRDQDKV